MAESVTRFLGQDESLGSTIQGLEKRLDGFGQSLVNIEKNTSMLPQMFARSAAAVAGFASSVAGTIVSIKTFTTALDFIERLNNLKSATGATRSELIKLQRAFSLTGSSADKVGPAINKVQDVITKAGENSPKAVEKLNLLKLTFEDLKDLSPAEQMEKVMKSIAALPTPAEQARAAMAIFGNELGRELLPLIKDFDGEVAKAVATLGSLPRIVQTYGPAMTQFANAIDALKKKPEEFAVGVVGPMSALLGSLAQRFATFDASGFGERIGITLNNTLREMLIWSENVYRLLGGIWNGLGSLNLGPVLQGALQQIGNLVSAATDQVGTIYNSLRDSDFSAIGQKLGAAISYGLEPLKMLNTDPSAAMDNFFLRMQEQTVNLGATLRQTVIDSLDQGARQAKAFDEVLAQKASGIGDRIVNGIYFSILNFPRWAEAFSSPVKAFELVWGASSNQSASVFRKAMIDAMTLFGSDMYKLFENPIALIAKLLATSLTREFYGFINTFQSTWESTNGSIIQKFKAAYDAVIDSTGRGLVGASETAANNTKQAGDNLSKGANDVLTSTAQARDNLAQAKADVTGTGGISPSLDANANALNQTAQNTQQASSSITTAFDGVAKSGQNFNTSTDRAADYFSSQVSRAGAAISNDVRSVMSGLTDAMRGFATEATLKQVVTELQTLNRNLPQPVLV